MYVHCAPVHQADVPATVRPVVQAVCGVCVCVCACIRAHAGFVWFVLGLKKRMYLYQFSQFAWTHTIILVVIVPSSFIVANMFQGIIWWLLPAMLVVANDICAYLAGQ